MLRVVAWVVALAAAAVTVAIVRAAPGDSLAGDSLIELAAQVAAGLLLMTAALVTRLSGAFRVLAAFAALAWLLVEWDSPGAGAAFTVGLVLFAAWPPLLAHAALRYRTRSLSQPAIAVLALGYANSVLVLGVASALFFDPVEQGCHACPVNQLVAAARPQVVHDLGRVGLSIAAAWSAAFVALALVRLARATSTRRRVEVPLLLPATAAVALFGARALHGSGRGFLSNDATDRALWAAQVAALALAAAGLMWERLLARRMRGELARLVVELGIRRRPAGCATGSPRRLAIPRSGCCTRVTTGPAGSMAMAGPPSCRRTRVGTSRGCWQKAASSPRSCTDPACSRIRRWPPRLRCCAAGARARTAERNAAQPTREPARVTGPDRCDGGRRAPPTGARSP
jgi:hypothetical protein